ncbi:hypothetical protein SALBM311S_10346 [Streptomyces alboniger]
MFQEAVGFAVPGEIGRDEAGVVPAEFTRQGLTSFAATTAEEHGVSVMVESPGGFGAYAGGGARDESHPERRRYLARHRRAAAFCTYRTTRYVARMTARLRTLR